MKQFANMAAVMLVVASAFAATPERKAILIGGYSDWENGQIVAFAEKKDPKVLVFCAAMGDPSNVCDRTVARFLKFTPNAEAVKLVPFPPAEELPGIRKKILDSDICYFGGGATEELAKTILHNHLGDTFRIAYRHGTVMSGFSAGAMILIHAGYTDYPKHRYDMVEGLDILPYFFGPHYQGKQWKSFDARLAEETDPSLPSEAWALEDGVNLFFRNEIPEVKRHLLNSHVWHFKRDDNGVWHKEDATHWSDRVPVKTDPSRIAAHWKFDGGILVEVDGDGNPVMGGWRFQATGVADALTLGAIETHGTSGTLDFSSLPLVGVADNAFLNGGTNGIVSLRLPASLEMIGNWAFQNVLSLESVDFGADSKLVSLGHAAFKGCTSLKKVTPLLPEGVTNVWDSFENCPLEGKLRIGFGSKSDFMIFHSSFRNHRLSEIELGPKVIALDHWIFRCDDNSTLTNVTAAGKMQFVRQNVFQGCKSLSEEIIKREGLERNY